MAGPLFPGVTVVEKPFLATTDSRNRLDASGVFIGRSDQGPLEPTLVRSWSQFVGLFGSNYTDLHYALRDYFSSGGRTAFIVRIPGVGGAVSELDVYPASVTDPQVNDTPLFTVAASNPGSWGDRLHIGITVRDAASYRFDFALFMLPAGETFDPTKRNSQYVIDQWIDVSLHPEDPRNLYDVVNLPSSSGSALIRISGSSYDPTDDGSWEMPGTAGGGTGLANGTNGTYSSPFVEATAYEEGFQKLEEVQGPLVMNLPGITTASLIRDIAQAAADRGDVFLVVDTPAGIAPGAAVNYANNELGLSALGISVPSYVGVYYPWIHVPVVNSPVPGRTTLRPPGGSVVGNMIRIDRERGAWKAPAGLMDGQLRNAVSIERKLRASDLETLNNGHVNAVRSIPGSGVTVMGARTVKKFGQDRYVNVRRNVISIGSNLKVLTEYAVFENNDERLWNRLSHTCTNYLAAMWQRGGLKGASQGDAFYVRCDASNNPPHLVDEGFVNVEVGVALLVPAEFVIITIGQFEGGGTVAASV